MVYVQDSRPSEFTSLFSQLSHYGKRLAVIEESGRQWTYSQLLCDSDALFAHIPAGSLILMVCSNDYATLCCYIGAMRKHLVPLLLPWDIRTHYLDDVIERFHPGFLWTGTCRMEMGSDAVVATLDGHQLLKTQFVDGQPAVHEHLALLLPTSGSTASPQMVRLSTQNLYANAMSIMKYLPIDTQQRVMLTLPMNYSYGLSIINTHILSGAIMLLPSSTCFDEGFWNFFETAQATSLSGVPHFYRNLQQIGFFSNRSYPHLCYLTQAGGKLPLELNRIVSSWCEHNRIRFFVMYGQTEATARISYLPSALAVSKCGSIGQAIAGGRLWIEDDDGTIIGEPMREGQLCYEGPNVALGYACNRLDLGLGDQWNNILRTGDIAYRDDEGFYYIVGRKNRFAKIFGVRTNLQDLEQILERAGFPVACIAKEEGIVVYTEGEVEMDRIRSMIVATTSIPVAAVTVVGLVRLPRNEAGKILYSQLEH